MDKTVMGDANIRAICKTGHMGYCDSSALQSLPLNARYVIAGEGAGTSGDITNLQQQIDELRVQLNNLIDTVNNLSQFIHTQGLASESYVNSAVAGEATLRSTTDEALATRISALEGQTSGGGGAGSIIELYSASNYSKNINLTKSMSSFDVIFIISSDNTSNINMKIINPTELTSSSVFVISVDQADSLTYTINADLDTLECTDSTSNIYIKRIVGIMFA